MHRSLPVVATAGFLLLAVLVQAGVCAPIDRFVIEHGPSLFHGQLVDSLDNLTRPADPVWAVAWTVAAALALALHGRRVSAAAWIVALACAFAVEFIGKLMIDQIQIPGQTAITLAGLKATGSFPSGHAIRALLLAGITWQAWSKAGPPALAWAGVVTLILVVGGGHTLTDVVGGGLAAAALGLTAHRLS
jgi:membrane-associated phospholipid phosphatase